MNDARRQARRALLRHLTTLAIPGSVAALTPSRSATAANRPLGGFDDDRPALREADILQASAWLGGLPLFCGRYFSAVAENRTLCAPSDLELLGRYRIRLLPIARQTRRVGLDSAADGFGDAQRNVAEYLRVHRAGAHGRTLLRAATQRADTPPTLFFLDCENDPPLASAYYEGWVAGLARAGAQAGLRFAPAIYMQDGDTQTETTIAAALDRDPQACAAIWLARYPYRPDSYSAVACRPWDALPLTRFALRSQLGDRIRLHQYAADCDGHMDLSVIRGDPLTLLDALAPTWTAAG